MKPGDSFIQRHTSPRKDDEQTFTLGKALFRVRVQFTGAKRNYIIFTFEDLEQPTPTPTHDPQD